MSKSEILLRHLHDRTSDGRTRRKLLLAHSDYRAARARGESLKFADVLVRRRLLAAGEAEKILAEARRERVREDAPAEPLVTVAKVEAAVASARAWHGALRTAGARLGSAIIIFIIGIFVGARLRVTPMVALAAESPPPASVARPEKAPDTGPRVAANVSAPIEPLRVPAPEPAKAPPPVAPRKPSAMMTGDELPVVPALVTTTPAVTPAGPPRESELPTFPCGMPAQVRFLADGHALVIGTGGAALYDLEKAELQGSTDAVAGRRGGNLGIGVAASADAKRLVAESFMQGIQAFELPTFEGLWQVKPKGFHGDCVAVSGDGRIVVASGANDAGKQTETLWILDGATGRTIGTLDMPFIVRALAVSKDGKRVAICGSEAEKFTRVVLVHDLASGKRLSRIVIQGSNRDCLEFRSDGALVHSGIGPDQVEVLDEKAGAVARTIDTGEYAFPLPKGEQRQRASTLGLTADEKTFACSVSAPDWQSSAVLVFDAKTKKVTEDLKVSGPERSAALSPDGKWVVVAGGEESKVTAFKLGGRAPAR